MQNIQDFLSEVLADAIVDEEQNIILPPLDIAPDPGQVISLDPPKHTNN